MRDITKLAEPYSDTDAKQIIRGCLDNGGDITYRDHAMEEMEADGLLTRDIELALRGGVVSYDSERHGTHRYKCDTRKLCVVVAFNSVTSTIIVTAWKKKSNH